MIDVTNFRTNTAYPAWFRFEGLFNSFMAIDVTNMIFWTYGIVRYNAKLLSKLMLHTYICLVFC